MNSQVFSNLQNKHNTIQQKKNNLKMFKNYLNKYLMMKRIETKFAEWIESRARKADLSDMCYRIHG